MVRPRTNSLLSSLIAWGLMQVFVTGAQSTSPVESPSRPLFSTAGLFEDKILAKGKGVEVRQSQVDEMYVTFKANRAAMGQPIPDALRGKIETDILDKLIATQLFLALATDADKSKAKAFAEDYVAEQIKQAPSEESFNRQIIAAGLTSERYRAQVLEQAIVKSIIDREIRAKKVTTDAQVREFYDKNPTLFQEPELVRVSHILFSTQNANTGQELSTEQKLEKRRLAEKVQERAKKGEDFAKLAKEFSDDAASKDKGGEYTIARARDDRTRAVVPEFEAAAFSLAPNQVSDLVSTRYGYHIIKALERIPARRMDFARVEARIRESLLLQEVEKELPSYVEKLRKAAGVAILQPREKK